MGLGPNPIALGSTFRAETTMHRALPSSGRPAFGVVDALMVLPEIGLSLKFLGPKYGALGPRRLM